MHAAWQGLAGVYEAPEAELLLTAMLPVRAGAASAGEKVSGVGAALVGYADEVEPIQAELASLRGRAQGFVTSIAGDDEWNKDGDKVDEHNGLLGAVSSTVARWMDAQRRCANAITALVGGTQFVPDNGDAQQAANEFGYTPEQLAGAAGSEQGLPWGRPAERDKPWWEDAWDGAYGFVVEGLVVDAIWGGLKDLGSLVGTQGWEQMKTSWAGLGTFAVALTPVSTLNHYTDVGPWEQGELGDTLTAAGKGLVAWDTWDDDPARAAGAVTGNVLMAVLGTKGAGGAMKAAGAGAVATRAPRVAAVAAQISARVPTLRLPSFSGRVDAPDLRAPDGRGIPRSGTVLPEADRFLRLSPAESWRSSKTLDSHFEDHGADFGARSADDYAVRASEFLQRAGTEKLPTKIDQQGTIRVYDPATNTFAAFGPDGTTKTFFKPTSPTYWDKQPGLLQ